MKVRIAKCVLDNAQPLEVMADPGLHGHADAVMELDRLQADVATCLSAPWPPRPRWRVPWRRRNRKPRSRTSTRGGLLGGDEMSAARCCRVWKVPMATPNWVRVLRYSMVVLNDSSIAPPAAAHNAMRASSTCVRSPERTFEIEGNDLVEHRFRYLVGRNGRRHAARMSIRPNA
jgi:hypothetical protein